MSVQLNIIKFQDHRIPVEETNQINPEWFDRHAGWTKSLATHGLQLIFPQVNGCTAALLDESVSAYELLAFDVENSGIDDTAASVERISFQQIGAAAISGKTINLVIASCVSAVTVVDHHHYFGLVARICKND